jgi:16S rRNA (cytosine1402-N4)-methyltransferase
VGMTSSSAHIPVLLNETIEALNIQPGGRYIDGTIGGGGHAAAILEHSLPGGQLLGIDADPEAVEAARERLRAYGNSVLIVNDNFVNLEAICIKNDGSGRGFSFKYAAPLDMRFSPGQQVTAADIVNTSSEAELADIIRNYGEEGYSHRIAKRIVAERPIKTTLELARTIERAVGSRRGKIHPATKTFQALRIAVNSELDNLGSALKQAVSLLGFEGRLVVISYHSLEDRIVKNYFRQESSDCICPPDVLNCTCHHTARLRLVNKKVTTPSPVEMEANPRSRSARLRIAERIITQQEWRATTERLCFLAETKSGIWRRPALLKGVRGASLVK